MKTHVPIEKTAAWLITVLVLVLQISACSGEPVPDQVTGSVSTKSGQGHSAAGSGIDSKNTAINADWQPLTQDEDLVKENAFVETTEMEAASLFVIGHLRDVKVGAVCIVIGEPIEKEQKITGKPPLDDLIIIALEAIIAVD